ncbi:MAG: MHYT domain-containing protein [Bdellovibrionales bacterium]
MQTYYVPSLVILSIVVAIFASYVALNLAHSVTQARGRAQVIWLICGSLAMGVGIWSMHFVGMLAFEMPGMEMAYDVPLMALSVMVAIAGSALALFVVSRPLVHQGSLISGGIAMAAAICGMHYIGMYSMRMAATIQWNLYLVFLSVLIALMASFAALTISIKLRNKPDRFYLLFAASVLMGFAISGMHYTGMIAATFIHDDSVKIIESNLLVTSGLTIVVMVTTVLILGLALASSIGQRVLRIWQRQSEEVLINIEEKYRLLVEAVKDYAIFMLDTKGFITTWNAGAQKITGYTAEKIIGKHVSTFYTKEDLVANVAVYELEIAQKNGHFENEVIRVRRDGSQYWANIVIDPLYDNQERLTGFSKVVRDITQLKEAAEHTRNINEELEKRVKERTLELQERELQLRTITNAIPILVAQLDRNENFLFANNSFCDWFHCSPNEISQRTFREILGQERYPQNKKYIDKALAGEIVTYERTSKSGDRQANLNITFVPEFGPDQQVKGFIVVATNVTRYKEIELELKGAKEAAEVANETKSAFLANMSHEIRTPLGAVLGFSELILDETISPSEKNNMIEVIKRNGKLLSTIINDILDLSKVEAGKLQVEKTNVQLFDLLNEISALLNLEASGKGIRLTISSEGLVPQVVKSDSTRLRQILFNIVGNAIKFTSRGSVDVRVMLSPTDASKLAFYVTDTGTGVDPGHAPKLFSPFTQADVTTTRKFGGTGLGLVLSKKLANALGGDVVLEKSVLGQGSTFVITIEHGQSQKVPFEGSEEIWQKDFKMLNLSVPEDRKKLASSNILLVDDSLDNLSLITKMLKIVGAKVATASNGKEAIEKAFQEDFDLVLMDLQMPEMDGYEATAALRQSGFSKPIIALTAHAMKEERERCLRSGFNDHLTKPIDRERLMHTLYAYLGEERSGKKASDHRLV